MSVNTRQVKMLTFMLSSFFAGIAGALFAHLLQFISPRVFDIIKSTDILIMVYLGGIGSIAGSILGATIYTVLAGGPAPAGVLPHGADAAAAGLPDALPAARHHGLARVSLVHPRL